MENYHNFATNARAMQERAEEKVLGEIPVSDYDTIRNFPHNADKMVANIRALMEKANIPFLGTDRNVLNLPGVGKSLTFRVIGITAHGRRIIEFDHDHTRRHSPIIDEMGKVVIVESKPIAELIRQYESMGEDISEYSSVYGYSLGETENRIPIYEYPAYGFELTDKLTNLELDT
jgi:lysine 2,3-aminomutase